MREFFRGWRRKIGCLTLVVALVAMAGWLRSDVIEDTFTIGFGSSIQCKLVSTSGRMIIANVSIDGGRPIRTVPWTSQKTRKNEWEMVFFDLSDRSQAIWQHSISQDLYSIGTDEMGSNFKSFAVKWCQFPYWSITIPLTLVSLWLLLSKPHKSTSKKIGEPTAKVRFE